MTWVGRFGRWLAVVSVAFALRHDITPDECLTAVTRAYGRHRDSAWCMAVLDDAQDRNSARMSRA